ncbi:hypothetical protein, partial [Deinococcus pimensis]|uniref:hypothetical protein n=1 Tax=Deinococcus pimensis TaxID=309888 RepID=UPI0005EBD8F4
MVDPYRFHGARRLALGLALGLTLWSCNSPTSTPQPGEGKNPYAGGRSYPWSAPAQIDPSNPYATPTPWPTWTSPT